MANPNKFMQNTLLVTFPLLVTFVRWLLPAYPGGCRPAEKAGKALGERGGRGGGGGGGGGGGKRGKGGGGGSGVNTHTQCNAASLRARFS